MKPTPLDEARSLNYVNFFKIIYWKTQKSHICKNMRVPVKKLNFFSVQGAEIRTKDNKKRRLPVCSLFDAGQLHRRDSQE